VEFRILGPLEVLDNRGRPLPLGAARQRALLAVLVVNANRAVSLEGLVEELWQGTPPDGAAGTVRAYVCRVRGALVAGGGGDPSPLFTAKPSGYGLRLGPDDLDSARFERAVARAGDALAAGRAAEAAAGLRAALGSWRGSALVDAGDAPSARAEALRLEGLRLAALEDRVEADLACGRHDALAGELEALISAHPLRERLWCQRMLALYRGGRQAEALRAFQALRAVLGEVGIEPAPATRDMERAIVAQSPALDFAQEPLTATGGALVGAAPAASLPRGTVSFLSARRRPGAADEPEDAAWRRLGQLLAEHGGHDVGVEGGAALAAFAAAADAVAAALAAGAGAALASPWSMAVHTGVVAATATGYAGIALQVVSRMSAVAHPGQVLVSRAARTAVGARVPRAAQLVDLGAVRLTDQSRPRRLFELRHPQLPAGFPAVRSLDASPNNLPLQLSSFIGRVDQIERVKSALLAGSRLCTLTGTGGCGKTRLALQVAAELAERFDDGVWLVDLSSIPDPALVPEAVAAVLDVREAGTGTYAARRTEQRPAGSRLASHLRRRHVLVVLDNCEHVVAACAALAEELLRSCPGLTVLSTSREPLGVDGEDVQRVPPLAVPPPGPARTVEELGQYESVRLFLDRAAHRRPELRLDGDDVRAVVEICRRVEGLPLAIELAAARVRMLSPGQIVELFDDRFGLLNAGSRTAAARHQTLRAMIDWSHDELTAGQQVVLRRLSVFAGGFDLAAVQHVCAGAGLERFEILDLLGMLVDKSLVETELHAGATRYRLLDSIRHYAAGKLALHGEQEVFRAHHRAWYLAMAEESEPLLAGPDQARRLDVLASEHDNLRSALEPGGGIEAARESLRVAAALGQFWLVRGFLTEGRGHLGRLLAAVGNEPTVLRARALAVAGHLALFDADLDEAAARAQAALVLSGTVGYRRGEEWALRTLAGVAGLRVRLAEAAALHQQAVAISRELSDGWGEAFSLTSLGNIEAQRGDFGQAVALYDRGLLLRREMDDAWGLTWSLFRFGVLRSWQGRFDEAEALLDEGLAVSRRLDYGAGTVLALAGLGEAARLRGDGERAVDAFGQARSVARDMEDHVGLGLSIVGLARCAVDQNDLDGARRWVVAGQARRLPATPAIEAGLLGAEAHLARHGGDGPGALVLLRRALTIQVRLGDVRATTEALEVVAGALAEAGDAGRAVSLLAAAAASRTALGAPVPPVDQGWQASTVARLRRERGRDRFSADWAVGAALFLGDAVDLALCEPARPAGATGAQPALNTGLRTVAPWTEPGG